ncbi:hypothetical protein AVEN_133100-1 [Araneus ventricosus]|uniref:Uncharacterized protein n=1 Tax=Araneus ventricosus TaxID=182803 RepID=A0A4Y2G0T1_ARAVE|nr:hypothetical protein AVEN_133100-1 [Araneus ventricosus]
MEPSWTSFPLQLGWTHLKEAATEDILDFSDCGSPSIFDCSYPYPDKLVEKSGNIPTEQDLDLICPHFLTFSLCHDISVQKCVHPSQAHQFTTKESKLYREI